ncbi:MAG TPA: dihydrolipoamide acetyltransferase family protein [Bacteroidales bacterium]|nr:dihydrolipoamide acetyltransferase family protein [Bacteroidales bacterium]
MPTFDLVMPKLGESIIEATIIRWMKKPGDKITEDEPIAEIATDKVDSEIPSPVEGVIVELKFSEGEIVPVGKVIAVIDLSGDMVISEPKVEKSEPVATATTPVPVVSGNVAATDLIPEEPASNRFYSPLVRSMAKEENISLKELDNVSGSGKDGRLTKQDMVAYLETRKSQPAAIQPKAAPTAAAAVIKPEPIVPGTGDVIVEMDRMRRLIADHMVMSKNVSPHVTSFIEVDMTNIVRWREKVKDDFAKREGQKLTFTPFFIEAAAKALKEFPNVNASIEGYNVIQRRNVNVGMAAALPNGNLIVPVIKNADQKNLKGIAFEVNSLADKARKNKLDPNDIQGGTFTITNFGTFDSLTGTPIINQPQVAILGIGTIKKRPWVLETSEGDVIAIRHICMLSLAYDHRIVDGALGGQFIKRMQQLLESFDPNTAI